MVPGAGLEPARRLIRGILSPLRLPISPSGQDVKRGIIAIRIEYVNPYRKKLLLASHFSSFLAGYLLSNRDLQAFE